MDRPFRTLPMRTEPIDGEALDSWLETASHRLPSTWDDFTEAGGLPVAAGVAPHGWSDCHPRRLPAIGAATGQRPLNCLRLKPDDIG